MGEGNVIPTQAYPPSNDAPAYHTDDTPGALPPPTAEPTAGAVSVPPSSCEPPNEEDNDAEWGFPEYLAWPALADAFRLDVARQQCQAWASACGFNIVQKSADRKAGKATFRCSCKGRKFTGGGNHSIPADDRRTSATTYALPGDNLCPFQ